MNSVLGIIQFMLGCGTILCLAFLVLLAMPKSKLREILMPVVGWAFAAFCAFYCISPVDLVPEAFFGPFGLVDDLGAAVAGVSAAAAAMKVR